MALGGGGAPCRRRPGADGAVARGRVGRVLLRRAAAALPGVLLRPRAGREGRRDGRPGRDPRVGRAGRGVARAPGGGARPRGDVAAGAVLLHGGRGHRGGRLWRTGGPRVAGAGEALCAGDHRRRESGRRRHGGGARRGGLPQADEEPALLSAGGGRGRARDPSDHCQGRVHGRGRGILLGTGAAGRPVQHDRLEKRGVPHVPIRQRCGEGCLFEVCEDHVDGPGLVSARCVMLGCLLIRPALCTSDANLPRTLDGRVRCKLLDKARGFVTMCCPCHL
mmetsp:Transcript_111171/g.301720  ORF Transcript_111171/g.301720 Transcript_111171/m.301720 type:complete len:278 (+) Transcript_111171:2-835(+)